MACRELAQSSLQNSQSVDRGAIHRFKLLLRPAPRRGVIARSTTQLLLLFVEQFVLRIPSTDEVGGQIEDLVLGHSIKETRGHR